MGGCKASLGRGRRGRAVARWRAGSGQPVASAAVSQGRELQRNNKVSFLSTTPFSFLHFHPSFVFKGKTHSAPQRRYVAKMAAGGRRSGRCLKDAFFSFLFLSRFCCSQEAKRRSGGEADPERRLHPSTYVVLGNYRLAVNSVERRQPPSPLRKKRAEGGKRKNCHGPNEYRYRKYKHIQINRSRNL